MPYATLDAEGRPIGFYHEARHGARLTADGSPNEACRIPVEAIEISDELWAQWNGSDGGGSITHTHALKDGKLVDIGQSPVPVSMDDLRARRNRILMQTDGTQSPDRPDSDNKQAWATYRQALRDLPAHTTDPNSATWPEPPA